MSRLSLLEQPLKLPCGTTLKNRICKSAMTEGLATMDGVPTDLLCNIYNKWSDSGAGLLITGNVQIDPYHLERPGNVIIDRPPSDEMKAALRKYAEAATRNNTAAFVQISHAGRQTNSAVNPRPKSSSDVQLKVPGFAKPTPLTTEEIKDLINRFAVCASACKEAGFSGCQLHAAHGYLLSQFLSPKANIRTDEYGGSLENRARMLLEAIRAVRAAVGPGWPVAVKLNSADFQKGGFAFEDALTLSKWLEDEGVDLIEVSGGMYEQPKMMGFDGFSPNSDDDKKVARTSTAAREAYFVDFAVAMNKNLTKVPLMVTGGFRTRAGMEHALQAGVAVVGLARPMVQMMDAPKQILGGLEALPKPEEEVELFPWWLSFLKMIPFLAKVNRVAAMPWYYEQIWVIAETGSLDPNLTGWAATGKMAKREKELLGSRSSKPP